MEFHGRAMATVIAIPPPQKKKKKKKKKPKSFRENYAFTSYGLDNWLNVHIIPTIDGKLIKGYEKVRDKNTYLSCYIIYYFIFKLHVGVAT